MAVSVPPRVKDMMGMSFGRLTVIQYAGLNHKNFAMWKCRCECGKTTTVYGSALRNGHTRSCGCLNREHTARMGKGNLKHGHSRRTGASITYRSWQSMIQRCENPSHTEYMNYGGRGITICTRWRESFDSFLDDMGSRPNNRFEIERINNDGNYDPSNCRWASRQDQCRNMRSNRMLACDGQTRCLAEWVEITGISRGTIKSRLARGWDEQKAISTPVH